LYIVSSSAWSRRPAVFERSETWYDFLGRKEMVKALLDRLRHRCTTIAVEGSSHRTPEP